MTVLATIGSGMRGLTRAYVQKCGPYSYVPHDRHERVMTVLKLVPKKVCIYLRYVTSAELQGLEGPCKQGKAACFFLVNSLER